jgi:hypothetical protein
MSAVLPLLGHAYEPRAALPCVRGVEQALDLACFHGVHSRVRKITGVGQHGRRGASIRLSCFSTWLVSASTSMATVWAVTAYACCSSRRPLSMSAPVFSRSLRIAFRTTIAVQGARVHNLKNVSLEIPRDSLVVVTGLSGSGKSSLAFDTVYAEGQRRRSGSSMPTARRAPSGKARARSTRAC